eukprot:gene13016-17448_t
MEDKSGISNPDSYDEAPSIKALDDGYNQTYLVMKQDYEKNNPAVSNDDKSISDVTSNVSSSQTDGHEVFFRCGNWCYKGLIQFNGLKVGTEDLPVLIPTLQRQQGSLRYYCNSKSIPISSNYASPIAFLEDACEFIATEIVSDNVDKELRKMSNVFPWIDDDTATTYFELSIGVLPSFMEPIHLIANKTYSRGLIIISIYFERSIYFVIQNGEGDQPLLDVRFPDVSKHGQGLFISSFNDYTWKKLTLWHVLETSSSSLTKKIPKIRTLDVSTKNYEQTYCILKSSFDANSAVLSVHHDVLFRFGSWCYSGRVQLTPSLTLSDIPYVIPALRMQQSRLDYLCDVTQVPTTSPFAPALEYIKYLSPRIEDQIADSEETLRQLIERLTALGLGESVGNWLEGDPNDSFFEFKVTPDAAFTEKFKNIELIVSKCYHPSGIITMVIVFHYTIYVSVLESNGENPLLDSRFPDVSGKGRGYQLQAYNEGHENWPDLRKVSIWQTIAALEKEFRERANHFAQAKKEAEQQLSLNSSKGITDIESVSSKNDGMVEVDLSDSKQSSHVSSHEDTRDNNNIDEKSAVRTNSLKKPIESLSDLSLADAKDNSTASPHTTSISTGVNNLTSLDGASSMPRRVAALPHHIPKSDMLSKKLEDIRKNMGEGGMRAPWDAKGRPLGSIKNDTIVDSRESKK